MNKRPGIMGSIHRAWHGLEVWPNLRLALAGIAILLPARLALSDYSAMEPFLAALRRQAGGGLLMSKVAVAIVLGAVAMQEYGIALMLFGGWGAIRDRRDQRAARFAGSDVARNGVSVPSLGGQGQPLK